MPQFVCTRRPLLKAKTTLYVDRPVGNASHIIRWCKDQGMETTLPAHEMHVTVAYSKATVEWGDLEEDRTIEIVLGPSFKRRVEPLGPKGALVLHLGYSPDLQERWQYFRDHGASWDWEGYQPHVTLTYSADPRAIWFPYPGPILLGPERFGTVNSDWSPSEK